MFFFFRERVLNTSRSRLEEANIAGLRPNTTYSFRVAALTESGVGASSDPLVVITRPELRVPSAPQNVRAIPSTTHLIVTWNLPAITNGRIHMYRLYYYEVLNFYKIFRFFFFAEIIKK